jgi:basic membrane protein A
MSPTSRLGAGVVLVALLGAGIAFPLLHHSFHSSATPATSPSTAATGQPGDATTVCLVSVAGAFDDAGLDQLARDGVRDAESDLGVTGVFLASGSERDVGANLDRCVRRGAGLTVSVGPALAAATERAARANPGSRFAIVGVAHVGTGPTPNPGNPPNLDGVTFRLDQVAFLAGYLAAGMTKSGIVGTFGSIHVPAVTKVMDGFAAGVFRYNLNKGTNVRFVGWDPATESGAFTGDPTDRAEGRRAAAQLIVQGADVILSEAGAGGLGAGALAQDVGNVVVIGQGADGFVTAPQFRDVWLTSLDERVDVAVEAVIRQVVEGSFRGGHTYTGNLRNGGVALAPFHTFDSLVPTALKDDLAELRQQVIDGTVSIDPRDYLPTGQ